MTDFLFHANLAGKIDADRGIIRDASIITEGEAKGHQVLIDAKTIDQIYQQQRNEPLVAYWTHEEEEGKLGQEVGHFSAFHKDGPQLRAHFSVIEPFKVHHRARYDYLFALAKESPRFGVSLRLRGEKVWKLADGTEIPHKPGDAKPEGSVASLPFARVHHVSSADFVREPAANNGLFSAGKLTALLDGKDKLDADVSTLTAKLAAAEGDAKAKESLLADLTVKYETANKTLEGERAAFAAKETEFTAQKTAFEKTNSDLSTQVTALASDIEARKRDAAAKEEEFKASMKKMEEVLLEHGGCAVLSDIYTATVDHKATWLGIRDPIEKTRYFQKYRAEILRQG